MRQLASEDNVGHRPAGQPRRRAPSPVATTPGWTGNGGCLSPALVRHLQRTASNRAVSALVVQRHAAAEDPDFTQASAAVQVPLTAVEDEEQPAVSRTAAATSSSASAAPVQRAVGIAKDKTQQEYVKTTLKGISGDTVPRGSFVTDQAGRINNALAEHKVHPALLKVADLGEGGTMAAFRPRTWEILINEQRFPDPLPRQLAIGLGSALYHEARHAEQWFSLIRLSIFELRRTHPDQMKNKNTYTVNERVPAANEAIKAAFATTEKKDFSKGEKREWATHLYDRSVTPASGIRPATLSPELWPGRRDRSARHPLTGS